MSRSADYVIKGFLYQFNKTLVELLGAGDEDIVTVEGVVEDVEIRSPSGTTAIQCKYHEASDAFAPSRVYKALLQMMLHFQCNPKAAVNYRLFAHFPGAEAVPSPGVSLDMLRAAVASNNKDLERYTESLRDRIDLEAFLGRVNLEFGPSYDDLTDQAASALEANGIPAGDIDTLAYPNAVQMIAEISTKHESSARRITKVEFLERLQAIRKTAVSRWTLASRSRKQLLDARRRQLRQSLSINARFRCVVIDAQSLDDYADAIVLFIRDYLEKYHSKPAHVCTPVFCLCTSVSDFKDVLYRLYKKGTVCNDGYVADRWDEGCFLREPLRQGRGSDLRCEFSVRLVRWEDHGEVLDAIKCDDLLIIGEHACVLVNMNDVNVEHLAVTSLKEARYLMGVSDVYE